MEMPAHFIVFAIVSALGSCGMAGCSSSRRGSPLAPAAGGGGGGGAGGNITVGSPDAGGGIAGGVDAPGSGGATARELPDAALPDTSLSSPPDRKADQPDGAADVRGVDQPDGAVDGVGPGIDGDRAKLPEVSTSTIDSGVEPDSRTASRVPAKHRPSSAPCPQARGPGASSIPASCRQGSGLAACLQDGDCTAGLNGRCEQVAPAACEYACTYDRCSSDADCSGNLPCGCRETSSSTTANACTTAGDCRVDADCGRGGSCSPSLVGTPGTCIGTVCQSSCPSVNCGHGYFCHTPKDSCVDDSDCPVGACTFDVTGQSWLCVKGYGGG